MKTKKEKQPKVHVIYSNEYDDALFQGLRKENADETEEYVWDVYNDFKNSDYHDFMCELQHMPYVHNLVLVGTVGLWNGRRQAGALPREFKNVLNAFNNCDYVTLYVENKRVYLKGVHHDGTHYMELRAFRKQYGTEAVKSTFSAYTNSVTSTADIERATRTVYPEFKKQFGL